MPNHVKDIAGQRFGRLIVVSECYARSKHGLVQWNCACDCGEIVVCLGATLRYGEKRSCGCLRLETHSTHQMSNTKTYKSWQAMKRRCYYTKGKDYHSYGGRGIKVCERWLDSFENFLEDMRECPEGLSLERKNVNGNYELDNCKWATALEQAGNKRPFSEQHKKNMRHPKKKGHKQTKEHLRNRIEAYKKTVAAKKMLAIVQ